ncbi:diguanylate cyclase [Fontimonas sp. SYSU GA230001]|uniref:diguanylate cyclase n=1 Tax=Fontimonas sp. SYSU GA230001 TaxID=3142450 RepID=UPI0032B53C89
MTLNSLPAAEVSGVLTKLQQAIDSHQLWHSELNRTLICALPPRADDLAEDAHCRCRFGQWYASADSARLHAHPAFVALGDAHARMHALARELLQTAASGRAVSTQAFDSFAAALQTMRLEVSSLKQELVDAFQNTDPLTGAVNRNSLLARLREQHAAAQRGIETSCVAMVDLDRFKRVNDTHGHAAGDCVLAAAARCLMENVRPYDVVYRYGGEEFLIAMRHAGVADAAAVLERVRARLAATAIDIGDKTVRITASFGVAALDPAVSVETAIARADEAMYAAKSAGRNTVRAWQAPAT